jgi:hypothetical protein
MNSLVFLLLRSAKNTLLELGRKPAKLLLWVLVIAGIGGIFILSLFTTRQSTEASLDLVWLKGILFLLILIFVVTAIQKGLAKMIYMLNAPFSWGIRKQGYPLFFQSNPLDFHQYFS